MFVLFLTWTDDDMGQTERTPTPLTLILDTFRTLEIRKREKDYKEARKGKLTIFWEAKWPTFRTRGLTEETFDSYTICMNKKSTDF